MRRLWIAVALSLVGAHPAHAQVSLPKIFADHMVLQRNQPIGIYGWAAPGEQVNVTLEAASAVVTADLLGRWQVALAPHAAGGPFELSVRGTNAITLHDLLIGDVWVASGQSNMKMTLNSSPGMPLYNSAAEIAAADYPQIRLMTLAEDASPYPLENVKRTSGWVLCTPRSAAPFSAVAYFFGRDLYRKEHVPIGLIDSAWGGTPAEAWVSPDALAASPLLGQIMRDRANYLGAEEENERRAGIAAQAARPGTPLRKTPSAALVSWEPGALYNAMIAPLTGMRIRGVIWYQGEANAGRGKAEIYADLFRLLITDWRAKWQEPAMPFLYVQLAGWASPQSVYWAMIQEAQRRTLSLPSTGMAVSRDLGEENNIHYAHKQEVGARLALQAEAISYGEEVVKDGPLFRSAVADNGAMRITFDSAAGLKTTGGAPGSFEVAGIDGKFKPAQATIDGMTIVARSNDVLRPVAVRYAWAAFPLKANLVNGAGLPASSFNSLDVYTNP